MGITAGVFNETFEKMTREHCVFERWTLFWQNMGVRTVRLLENGRFLIEYGHESSILSWKFGKKRGILFTFWPIVLTELTFFWLNMGMTGRGFSMKNLKKMTWEQRVFERMNGWLIKHGHESSVFFRDLMFFWQNMGTRADILSLKIRTKGILFPISFFGP